MTIKKYFLRLRNKPVVSYLVLALCGAAFLAMNLSKDTPYFEKILSLLAPRWEEIKNGNFWGLVTSAFVHIEVIHLFFNMSWVGIFGRVMEPDLGKIRYAALIIISAAVSSFSQAIFSSGTGIGFSGVVYALFGFAVAVRKTKPAYGSIADSRTIAWMAAWTVLCFVLTYAGVWNIGNAAHVSGFLFGVTTGFVSTRRVSQRRFSIGLLTLSALTLAFSQLRLWDEVKEKFKTEPSPIVKEKENPADHREDHFFHSLMLLIDPETKSDGIRLLKDLSTRGHENAKLLLARILASDGDQGVRNGRHAVVLAEDYCASREWKTPFGLDTLAAAYAETNNWRNAEKYQKMALRLLEKNDEMMTSFSRRLAGYARREKERF